MSHSTFPAIPHAGGMHNQIEQFILDARRQLQSFAAMDALHDPLGGLVALVQAGPHSGRSRDLRTMAQAIFDASASLGIRDAAGLDRAALLVICRLAEEHLACRYSGEEWGDAFNAMDEALRQDK